jgi:hypothetical protein
MATAPKALMGDAEVEDQAPAARLVLEVILDRHVVCIVFPARVLLKGGVESKSALSCRSTDNSQT